MNNVQHDQPTSHPRNRVRSAGYSDPASPSFGRSGTTHAQGALSPQAGQDTYSFAGSLGTRSAAAWGPRHAAPTPASCSAPPGHRPATRCVPPPPLAADPVPTAGDPVPTAGDETDAGVSANSTSSLPVPATPPEYPAWQQWAGVDDLDAGLDAEATSSTASSAYAAPESWADGDSFDAATSSTASSAGGAAEAWSDEAALDAWTTSTASSTADAPEAWADEAAFGAPTVSTASSAGDGAPEAWAGGPAFGAPTVRTASSAGSAPEAWADEADEAGASAFTMSTASGAGGSAWAAAHAGPPLGDPQPEGAAESTTPSGASSAWATASTSSTFSTSSGSAWYDLQAQSGAGGAADVYATPPAVARGPRATLSAAYRSLDRAFEQLDVGEAGDADEAATASGPSFEAYGPQISRLDARPKCFLATGSSPSASSDGDAPYARGGRGDAPAVFARAYAGYEG